MATSPSSNTSVRLSITQEHDMRDSSVALQESPHSGTPPSESELSHPLQESDIAKELISLPWLLQSLFLASGSFSWAERRAMAKSEDIYCKATWGGELPSKFYP